MRVLSHGFDQRASKRVGRPHILPRRYLYGTFRRSSSSLAVARLVPVAARGESRLIRPSGCRECWMSSALSRGGQGEKHTLTTVVRFVDVDVAEKPAHGELCSVSLPRVNIVGSGGLE